MEALSVCHDHGNGMQWSWRGSMYSHWGGGAVYPVRRLRDPYCRACNRILSSVRELENRPPPPPIRDLSSARLPPPGGVWAQPPPSGGWRAQYLPQPSPLKESIPSNWTLSQAANCIQGEMPHFPVSNKPFDSLFTTQVIGAPMSSPFGP